MIPACQHDGTDEAHAARDHHDEKQYDQQANVHFARRPANVPPMNSDESPGRNTTSPVSQNIFRNRSK
jgi:hypothetical protein